MTINLNKTIEITLNKELLAAIKENTSLLKEISIKLDRLPMRDWYKEALDSFHAAGFNHQTTSLADERRPR